MPRCSSCGSNVMGMDLVGDLCEPCHQNAVKLSRLEAEQARAAAALISLTTEATGAFPISERLGIVSGSCIYGQHLGKDILALWRDALGGRGKAIEKVFSDARAVALDDLRLEAHSLGATSVVAIQISHQEITGGGKSMIMVTATGTAVR